MAALVHDEPWVDWMQSWSPAGWLGMANRAPAAPADLVRRRQRDLLEHARRERLALLGRPVVEFRTDEHLRLGEFGIQARLVKPAEDPAQQPRQGEASQTMVFSAERLREPMREAAAPVRTPTAVVVVDGRRMTLGRDGAVLGRSRDSDIVVSDANVSRRHAEIRPSGAGWVIADMNSTNGVMVNGQKVAAPQALHDGDRIVLGTAAITFELEG